MFERSSEQTRRVVILASAEAERFRDDYIGTSHFMLGILRGYHAPNRPAEEGEAILAAAEAFRSVGDSAADALQSFGLQLDVARQAIELAGDTEAEAGIPGRLFSKKLEEGFASAARQPCIEPMHVLVEILRSEDSAAVKILETLNISTRALTKHLDTVRG